MKVLIFNKIHLFWKLVMVSKVRKKKQLGLHYRGIAKTNPPLALIFASYFRHQK